MKTPPEVWIKSNEHRNAAMDAARGIDDCMWDLRWHFTMWDTHANLMLDVWEQVLKDAKHLSRCSLTGKTSASNSDDAGSSPATCAKQ